MKRVCHFSWVWCLLIAAALLVSGFGSFDAGKTVQLRAVAGEESIEELEGEELLENLDELSFVAGSTSIGSLSCSVSPFTKSLSSDRIVPVNPSGWRMPVRI